MREATHDTEWMTTEDSALLGLALGFDFCAEHEWGVERLRVAFGVSITDTPLGLADRKVTNVPEGLLFETFKINQKPQRTLKGTVKVRNKSAKNVPAAALVYTGYSRGPDTGNHAIEERKNAIINRPWPTDSYYVAERHDIATAWGEDGFAIAVRGEGLVAWLSQLHQGFLNKDIIFGAGIHGGWAKGRGLSFILDSRMTDKDRYEVLESDMDHKALMDFVAASGIKERLKAAGKKWYALSPRWTSEERKDVTFFLNPAEQRANNHGWFSIAELDAWIKNEGPIPMTTGKKVA